MSPHRVADAASAVSAGALVILLVVGVRGMVGAGDARLVTHLTSPAAIASDLASDAVGLIQYSDSLPPDRATAVLLAAGAQSGRPISFVAPPRAPRLTVRPPSDLMAQRRAALDVTVRGSPSTTVEVAVEDGAGRTDTVAVFIGSAGFTTTRVAIEPARAGVEHWTVRAASETATASAWVQPAAAPRVLVLTGAPGWETRYLVRALESSGMDVVVRQDLGRDLSVSSGGGSEPSLRLHDPAALADFDVVVSAGSRTAEAHTALDRWMRGSGGGVLYLDGPGADGSTEGRGTDLDRGSEIVWSGPAELIPLPDLGLELTGGRTLTLTPSDVPVARLRDGGVLVSAATLGRGRSLRSGLPSWHWVLSGGASDAHAAWWTSAIEWLASGLTSDVVVATGPAQPYTVSRSRLEGALPAEITAVADSGRITVPVIPTTDTRGTASFVPTTIGPQALSTDERGAVGAAIVTNGTDRLSWAEAAVEIGGSGGAVLPPIESARTPTMPLERGRDRSWLVFLLIAGAMGAGWTTRRVGGLA